MPISIFLRLGKLIAGFVFMISPLALALPPGLLDNNHPAVQAVIAVQKSVTDTWMQQPEVLGTAVSANESGTAVLVVYVDRDAAKAGDVIRDLAKNVGEIDVQVNLTDKFRSMRGNPHGGSGHTALQTPPIQLGTSGGWSKDLANGYCCGGTLGSLVQIGSTQYILSNYHVFESDIVPGGNNTVATTGDPIIQPGLIDVNCNVNGAQTVATNPRAIGLLYAGSSTDAIANPINQVLSFLGATMVGQ